MHKFYFFLHFYLNFSSFFHAQLSLVAKVWLVFCYCQRCVQWKQKFTCITMWMSTVQLCTSTIRRRILSLYAAVYGFKKKGSETNDVSKPSEKRQHSTKPYAHRWNVKSLSFVYTWNQHTQTNWHLVNTAYDSLCARKSSPHEICTHTETNHISSQSTEIIMRINYGIELFECTWNYCCQLNFHPEIALR